VGLRNRVSNAFAQIDVQLKRRYDLIPNLVETARAYMQHERETLEAVTEARNQAARIEANLGSDVTNVEGMKQLMSAEGALSGAMGRLFAVMESYPDLKASQNMAQLSEELTSTENKVGFARQAYNDAVNMYKTTREQFPAVMIAGSLGFQDAIFFEVEQPAQREAPKVSFR
jgi:LemA protein